VPRSGAPVALGVARGRSTRHSSIQRRTVRALGNDSIPSPSTASQIAAALRRGWACTITLTRSRSSSLNRFGARCVRWYRRASRSPSAASTRRISRRTWRVDRPSSAAASVWRRTRSCTSRTIAPRSATIRSLNCTPPSFERGYHQRKADILAGHVSGHSSVLSCNCDE